ncbi:E3 ubiquitin-protein ligase SGR9, amyloplastic-like [Impatiens glandulifera]|uniref:E3 ubiquitin-protein ligase SGR9, amyloplastic-like n=1 Tax=Impatiens glandulifera TaxID=253017 RepID=UPI001FB0C434|nr:E3 ubiquitin-protein ligase SGR9, amyloplastic-like [Impatiens glandulifera]
MDMNGRNSLNNGNIINNDSRPIESSAPAAATRPSSSRHNSRNNNNNASYLPAIYQRSRTITTGRRRRNLLVNSMIESNAPAATATTDIVLGENFITPNNFFNMMTHEEILISPIEEEVDYEAGLNEGEIMMSVHKLRHCHSFLSEHEGEVCSICQEEFNQEEDDIYKLSCSHIYHFECIKTWLMQKNFCPICRAPAMYF